MKKSETNCMLGSLGTDWLRKEASFCLKFSFPIEKSIKQILIFCITARNNLIKVLKFETIVTIVDT